MSTTDIVSVCPGMDGLFGVVSVRSAIDPSDSTGKLIHSEYSRNGSHYCILSTNDSLGPLWVSHKGCIWIASSRGNVWTTAPVTWSPSTFKVQYETHTHKYGNWTVTTLPVLDTEKTTPTITAIWGTSDLDVHVATYEGVMYHWNGTEWRQFQTGIDSALNCIYGLLKESVYCVGYGSKIIHYNGTTWKKVELPTPVRKLKDTLTGIRVLNARSAAEEVVLICSRSGRLFRGNSQNSFAEIAHVGGAKFYGLGCVGNRILAPGGPSGIWEIFLSTSSNSNNNNNNNNSNNNNYNSGVSLTVSSINKDVESTGVCELAGFALFFIPIQQNAPSIYEYNPHEKKPWVLLEF